MDSYLIDPIMDEEELFFLYHRGELSDADAFELGLINGLGRESTSYKVCRYCNTHNLFWSTYMGKWRLFDSKGIHRCPVNLLKGL